jgi:5'-methylthioadenosine phosphorylase
MESKLGVIGGSGFYQPAFLDDVQEILAETPYGAVKLRFGKLAGRSIVFLARHGSGHETLPHQLNYRANVWALKRSGVRRIIATNAVGSLRPDLGPGAIILADQFIDFTKQRPFTFFEQGDAHRAHVDFTEPYCPQLRSFIQKAAVKLGMAVNETGCYVCTEGPRYESPAEVRMFRTLGGDVVGMTGLPEVVLARELGLCYANVSVVTNWAAGLSPAALKHTAVLDIMAKNQEKLRGLIAESLQQLPLEISCDCGNETEEEDDLA